MSRLAISSVAETEVVMRTRFWRSVNNSRKVAGWVEEVTSAFYHPRKNRAKFHVEH